jgi:predicted molibdopterin-dependent oxidoreductase YjgC
MAYITLDIDGLEVKASRGMTVLEVAQKANIYIPTLCAHPDLSPFGICWRCAVEIEGMTGFPSACTTPANDDMIFCTNTSLCREIRRHFLGIILRRHLHICVSCEYRDKCNPHLEYKMDIYIAEHYCSLFHHCELQKAAEYIGIGDTPPYIPNNLTVSKD